MRTEKKTYYVDTPCYSTHCGNYREALELYQHRKMYNDEVKLTDDYGKVIFAWSRK